MAETNDYLKQTAFSQAMANDSHLFHAFISRFDKKEKTILPHYHAELEIIIPFNVLGETYCAGRKYPLVHASAHILPPGSIHAFRIRSHAKGHVLVLKFNTDTCMPLLSLYKEWDTDKFRKHIRTLPVSYKGDSSQLAGIIQTLTQEGISPPESVSLLYSLLKSLFDITDKVRENKSHIRIRSVLDFLERVHKTPISLNEIQRESAMSKFHLCRLFKQSTGETIGHHLTQLRLNSAAKALADGNLNVTEACFQNGFEDLSYFIQVFKKKFGTTPKQWALTSNIKINESASTSA